jgi:hypothetical protein
VNRALDEVRRLRSALAGKTRELAELRGLVQKHLLLETEHQERELAHERDVSRKDYSDGFNLAHDVALGAHEEARPFVAGIREGFEAGHEDWLETAKEAFGHLHQRPQQPDLPDHEYELEPGA